MNVAELDRLVNKDLVPVIQICQTLGLRFNSGLTALMDRYGLVRQEYVNDILRMTDVQRMGVLAAFEAGSDAAAACRAFGLKSVGATERINALIAWRAYQPTTDEREVVVAFRNKAEKAPKPRIERTEDDYGASMRNAFLLTRGRTGARHGFYFVTRPPAHQAAQR